MKRRKTQSPFSIQWRLKKDYLHKLSEEDRAWLMKFEDEFHLDDFRNGELLHTNPVQRKEIGNNKAAARRDIVTASAGLDLTKPVLKSAVPNPNKYYSPSDYSFPSEFMSEEAGHDAWASKFEDNNHGQTSQEDALISLIEGLDAEELAQYPEFTALAELAERAKYTENPPSVSIGPTSASERLDLPSSLSPPGSCLHPTVARPNNRIPRTKRRISNKEVN